MQPQRIENSRKNTEKMFEETKKGGAKFEKGILKGPFCFRYDFIKKYFTARAVLARGSPPPAMVTM
jgi:hypothetical protein